jgi:hypothetical protein
LIGAVATSCPAAIPALEEVRGGKDEARALEVIVFRLESWRRLRRSRGRISIHAPILS